MLMPSANNAPVTQFTNTPPAKSQLAPQQLPVVPAQQQEASGQNVMSPSASSSPSVSLPSTATMMPQPVQPEMVAPQSQQPANVNSFQPASSPASVPTVATANSNIPPYPVTNSSQQVSVASSPADRLSVLEQQVTAMMNMLQSQSGQKSESEAQTDNKFQELNARIANLEVAFRQLTRMLRNSRGEVYGSAAVRGNSGVPRASSVSSPKMSYNRASYYSRTGMVEIRFR